MASDSTAIAVNGSYAAPAYDMTDQGYDAARASANTAEYGAADSVAANASGNGTSGGNGDIPKDEVGWYFVEQYYTTLSKSPEKLFLFYNKSSQFVSGTEAEKAPVCVGQKAINDRIKELDIQDCKVRVTNVDSQGSQSNIVIQVIGEISNKSAPQRKFTQTFVLAEQANGYFVLNDIFRYLLDEDEEFGPQDGEVLEAQADKATAELEEVVPAANNGQAASVEVEDIQVASVEEAQAAAIEEAGIPPTVEVVPVEDAPVAAVTATEPMVEVEAPAEQAQEPELSKEVQQPPATASPATQPTPEPTPKPAAPTSWAGLLRSNAAAAPAVPAAPVAASSIPSAPAKSIPAPTVQTQPTSIPTGPAASSVTTQDTDTVGTPVSSGSEWQTAGQDNSKSKSKGQQGAQTPAENSRAYIKNVNESIDLTSLQTALTKIADIAYIDINRQKNCAFVDFSTPAGYRAAVAANPFDVSGEQLYVEERRIRQAGNLSGGPGGRGGNAPRGTPRPGSQGRGTFNNNNNNNSNNNKDGPPRGNYGGRGRGGNVGARGRGGVSQAA